MHLRVRDHLGTAGFDGVGDTTQTARHHSGETLHLSANRWHDLGTRAMMVAQAKTHKHIERRDRGTSTGTKPGSKSNVHFRSIFRWREVRGSACVHTALVADNPNRTLHVKFELRGLEMIMSLSAVNDFCPSAFVLVIMVLQLVVGAQFVRSRICLGLPAPCSQAQRSR